MQKKLRNRSRSIKHLPRINYSDIQEQFKMSITKDQIIEAVSAGVRNGRCRTDFCNGRKFGVSLPL